MKLRSASKTRADKCWIPPRISLKAFALCLNVALLLGFHHSAKARERFNVILVHGLWAQPESLDELGSQIKAMGHRVYFVKYEMPSTCDQLAKNVRERTDAIVEDRKLNRAKTFVYGYSLGGMAIALSQITIGGIILDAPANYPVEACGKLPDYFPGSENYPDRVLKWRFDSDNTSPAVAALMLTKARVLVIGHEKDELIPQATILAYAHATQANVWWVPGTHEPDWAEVAHIIQEFILMHTKIGNLVRQ